MMVQVSLNALLYSKRLAAAELSKKIHLCTFEETRLQLEKPLKIIHFPCSQTILLSRFP